LHYVTHKLPTAPEEVQDPHNMWLSAWSQLGVAGLLALAGAVALAVRSWCRTPDAGHLAPAADARGGPVAGLVAAAALLAVPGAIGFFLLGPRLGVVALGLVAVVTVLAAAENPRRLEAPDRPLRALRAACAAGLVAFWIAEQIGTAVLDPPTAWAMLLVVAVSLGPERDGTGREGTAIGPVAKFALMALAMAACYAYVLCVVLPIAREDTFVALAAETTDPESRDELLRAAAKENPLAWEPAYRRGQIWETEALSEAGTAIVALERAITAYQEALARQPRLWKAYVALARCRLAAPGAPEDAEGLAAARRWLEAALALYPTHVRTRLLLAQVLDRSKAYPEAVREYERVQELDRLMPEAALRLRDDDRRDVEERLRQLREPVATEPGNP
jgi:tetratricopeptide (TPR) repeat protein